MMEFLNLGDLAHHLMRETNGELVMIRDASKAGLDAASDLLYNEVRSEFGVYQGAEGPFAAWPELAESTKEERLRLGYTENDPLLRSGELRDSTVKEVDTFEATVGSTSPIMEWQEFGTSRIPPRPVFGTALQRRWPDIQSLLDYAVASGFVNGKPIPAGDGYDLS